jgi:hypothetical protein
MDPDDVDFLMLDGVREDDHSCFVDNENPMFWSLYAYTRDEEVQCIYDDDTLEGARAYATWLYAQHGKDSEWSDLQDGTL